jgi:2-dehydro-3-deoxygluconokinase
MSRIAAIGEVMVELAPYPAADEKGREIKVVSYAGDTFNTAVYMSRLGTETEYVTILGDDAHSDRILQLMAEEAIGSGAVVRLPGRAPGLYMISNTPDGEREFAYWRKEAPARQLFASDAAVAALEEQLSNCDSVYVSGITLAIIPADARQRLTEFLQTFRARGGKVIFDSNYRPRLWASKSEARAAVMAVMKQTDIALLTLDDEQLLWDESSVEACEERYRDCQLDELVLKRGAEEVIVITVGGRQTVPVPTVKNVVDTTGAGDTFNAGYMAARLKGLSPVEAAHEGIRCAGIIIRHRGGVISRDVFQREYDRK